MSANPSDSSTPLAEIAHGPSKFEQFLDNNQKLLLVVAVLIAVGTAAFVVLKGVEKGKQETAGASMIDAMSTDDLKKMIDEHAGTQAAKSAQLLLADNQWNTGQKEASISTLREFLAKQSDHPAAPTAKASLASKLMALSKTDEATPLLQDLVDDPQARYLAAYSLISLGDIAAAAGDSEKAKSHYERVIAEYSDSDFASSAHGRLRDLGAVAPTVIPKPEPLEIKQPGEEEDKPAADSTPETAPEPSDASSSEATDKTNGSEGVSDKNASEQTKEGGKTE